jgi:ubiquinone/menaquinone biosynthesis C-methylase UbiE
MSRAASRTEMVTESQEHSEQPQASRAGWRRRVFAWAMSKGSAKHERAVAERKRALLGKLSGTVVEIGPGAGANLAYYAPGIRWIGIEPNPFMRPYLQREAERRGLRVEFRSGIAERLDLPDGTADAVVSTLVLCSVANPGAVLREAQRVLKPEGRFIFIEHVAAPRGTWLRRVQRWIRPFSRCFADGCTPDRETWAEIQTAGFAEVKLEHFRAPLWFASPHIAGWASKGAR